MFNKADNKHTTHVSDTSVVEAISVHESSSYTVEQHNSRQFLFL